MTLFVRLAPFFVLGLAACSSTPAPAPSAPVVSLAPAAPPATPPANASTDVTPSPAPAPAPVETTPAPAAAGASTGGAKPPFSKGEAMMVLSRVQLADCGQNVRGHIRVMFDPSGQVTTATIDEGPARGSHEGRCVEERFRALRISEFEGAPVTVGKAFSAR